MHVTKRIDLPLLERELAAAGVVVNGLSLTGTETDGELLTYQGIDTAELPPAAVPVVEAHTAPPLLVDFAGTQAIHAMTRTTDAAAKEVFRFPCDQQRLYEADLRISGVDAGTFVSKIMEGRFTWKRLTGNAIVVGLTVVSDIHDTAAASWAPNFAPVGTEIVFTVQGAAGRTIDWLLLGSVGVFAPGGTGA